MLKKDCLFIFVVMVAFFVLSPVLDAEEQTGALLSRSLESSFRDG